MRSITAARLMVCWLLLENLKDDLASDLPTS